MLPYIAYMDPMGYVLKFGSIMSFPMFSTWKVVSHREKAAIYIPSGKEKQFANLNMAQSK